MNKALKQIIDRHKSLEGDSYIEVIAFDDLKKDKKVRQTFFNINKTEIRKIQDEIEIYNTGSFGVYINVNPLSAKVRKKDTVKKYLFCFIDLDDANDDHKELVKSFLINNNIKYSYLGQSGSGYHFLIPINLETKNQDKIKGFLNYLKNNICDKTDVSTNDPTRIFRVPESIHNKKGSFTLKTLELEDINNKSIISNTQNISKFQEQNKKSQLDVQYLSSIEREDSFFSNILNNQSKWHEIFKMLNNHDTKNDGVGNNQIFNKNLAIFSSRHLKYYDLARNFMQAWNNQFVTIERFNFYFDKVKSGSLYKDNSIEKENMVNYYELYKWSKSYDLNLFVSLLEHQLKSSFLDEIEVYYLEDEKPEYQYLIYYSQKDYYVQKNMAGLVDLIYYESKEKGLDLVKEWNIDTTDEHGKSLSHSAVVRMIRSTIRTKLDKENRIKKIFNINYEPTNDKFIFSENKKYFNIYSKTNYWDYYEKCQNYSFPNITELIMNLCGNDKRSFDWFNKWLGFQIQNNSQKLPTAVIFQGQQGTGKGVFKSFILDNIFGSNVQEINQTHLEQPFNEYLLGKQIIVANEVIHNENKALLPNVLKNLVTDPVITISRKFRKEIVGSNYTHWIFCTNNDNPLKIDSDDRRYCVFYSKKLKGSEKAAVKFVRELQRNLDYELKQYVSYLKDLKIDEYEVRRPFMTQAKLDIIELNKDSVMKFTEYLKGFKDYLSVHIDLFENDKELGIIKTSEFVDYISTDSLYLLYLEWSKKFKEKGTFNKQNFSRKLSLYGVSSIVKKINGKTVRAYDLESIETFMRAEDLE